MSVLSPFQDIYIALTITFWPTFWQIWATPSLLFSPTDISRLFFFHVWTAFGPGIDENNVQLKTSLITQNARGVVLDIGAGHGHTAKYLDTACVTLYVALEPNPRMHAAIRHAAHAAGFTETAGTFLLLPCGAEDISTVLTSLGGYQPVDTLVSIITLCTVPAPCDVVASLATEVLKPGGQFLFIEHVRHPRPSIARWQVLWSPLWAWVFDGCRLDRPTHIWIQQVGGWAHEEVSNLESENEDSLICHRIGRFVKAA